MLNDATIGHDPDGLLTVQAVSELVSVHRCTTYRAIAAGTLPAMRLGPNGSFRIARAAVDQWLNREQRAKELTRVDIVRLLIETSRPSPDPGTWTRDIPTLGVRA